MLQKIENVLFGVVRFLFAALSLVLLVCAIVVGAKVGPAYWKVIFPVTAKTEQTRNEAEHKKIAVNDSTALIADVVDTGNKAESTRGVSLDDPLMGRMGKAVMRFVRAQPRGKELEPDLDEDAVKNALHYSESFETPEQTRAYYTQLADFLERALSDPTIATLSKKAEPIGLSETAHMRIPANDVASPVHVVNLVIDRFTEAYRAQLPDETKTEQEASDASVFDNFDITLKASVAGNLFFAAAATWFLLLLFRIERHLRNVAFLKRASFSDSVNVSETA